MMKKMKRYLALVLAMGLLLSGTTVMAVHYKQTGTSNFEEVKREYDFLGIPVPSGIPANNLIWIYTGITADPEGADAPEGGHVGDVWYTGKWHSWPAYVYDGTKWNEVTPPDKSQSTASFTPKAKSKSRSLSSEEKAAIKAEKEREEKEKAALEQASREAVRLEAEAAENGFANAAQMQSAQAADKSAGEYYNNAVLDTQGIEAATPVAQGGGLIVDGKVTNMTASISKAPVSYVDSVRAAQEGTVLNVVDVQFPATEAIINFYMPGVADGANIVAVQYVDGVWADVEVTEVRADHVALDLKGSGIVAFIAK